MASTALELEEALKAEAVRGGGEAKHPGGQGPVGTLTDPGCLLAAREGLTEFSCPGASHWTVPNCVGFQPPSCLKARPYLIILDGPRASAATQARQGQRSEGANHGQNTAPGAREDDAGNTSHLARTLFKVLCVSKERDVPLHSQGTSSRDGVPLPTRDPLPEPITLVPTTATPPLARGTPPVSLPSSKQQQKHKTHALHSLLPL